MLGCRKCDWDVCVACARKKTPLPQEILPDPLSDKPSGIQFTCFAGTKIQDASQFYPILATTSPYAPAIPVLHTSTHFFIFIFYIFFYFYFYFLQALRPHTSFTARTTRVHVQERLRWTFCG
jgi:hypothetical protein